jgi:CBS-domain-containing membrane protein
VEEVYLALRIPDAHSFVVVADLMRTDVVPLQLHDSVDRAMELFAENDLLELPLIDESVGQHVVGIVPRAELAAIYLRHVQGTVRTPSRT